MRHINTPNTAVFPLSSPTWSPRTRASRGNIISWPLLLTTMRSRNIRANTRILQYRGKGIQILFFFLHDGVELHWAFDNCFFVFIKAFFDNIISLRQMSMINNFNKLYSVQFETNLLRMLICISRNSNGCHL